MADLKGMLVDLGLTKIQTHIQSGNIVFESSDNEGTLREKIENAIEERFGFTTVAVLRTAAELRKLIANCPFSMEAERQTGGSSQVEVFYVALLAQPPPPGSWNGLDASPVKEEKYWMDDRDIYLLLPKGIRHSILVDNLDRSGIPSTIRNWKTLKKLDELARATI